MRSCDASASVIAWLRFASPSSSVRRARSASLSLSLACRLLIVSDAFSSWRVSVSLVSRSFRCVSRSPTRSSRSETT